MALTELHPPRREPNGRRQRESTAQERLNEINRQEAEAEMSLVRSQPHRQGSASPLAESALGRFVLLYKLDEQLFHAGIEYARVRGMWLAAIGAPRDERHGGSGRDLPMETVWKWRDDTAEWRKAMGDAGGKNGAASVEYMVCDNMDFAGHMFETGHTIAALTALAKIMGKV